MTQEDKELLLTDLCTRSMYGVKVNVVHHDKSELFFGKKKTLVGVLYAVFPSEERVIVDELSEAIAPINVRHGGFLIEEDCVKPYLRSMSSMTEDEKAELQEIVKSNPISPYGELTNKCDNLTRSVAYGAYDITRYLLSKHFDTIGLIEKDLALEAPKDMYK